MVEFYRVFTARVKLRGSGRVSWGLTLYSPGQFGDVLTQLHSARLDLTPFHATREIFEHIELVRPDP